jgi:hypothetical protein
MFLTSKTLKSIATAATAALLATFSLAASAEAGCGGSHGGGYKARSAYSTPSPAYAAKLRAKKAAEARAVAAAKRQKSIEIAKTRAAAKARTLAAAKSVPKKETVAAVIETATPEPTETAPVEVAVTPTTCRKFIAATGTTVEVPCSIE